MNQKRRGMDVDTRCPICLRQDEDGGHVFFKCKEGQASMETTTNGRDKGNLCEVSNNMLLLETILNLEEEDKLITCCTLWIWWAERNKANSGTNTRDPQQIVSSIISHVME
jgi:hypothetical protein